MQTTEFLSLPDIFGAENILSATGLGQEASTGSSGNGPEFDPFISKWMNQVLVFGGLPSWDSLKFTFPQHHLLSKVND